MATQTGSTYVCESMADIIKIPTVILGFRQAELEETVLERLRQQPTTENSNIDVLGADLAIYGCRRCRKHLVTLLSS